MGLLDMFYEKDKKPDKKVEAAVQDTRPVIAVGTSTPDEVNQFHQSLISLINSHGDKALTEFLATKTSMNFTGAESDAYKALLAVFGVKGVTGDTLINAANKSIEMITKELTDFQTEYRHQAGKIESDSQAILADTRRKILETEQLLGSLRASELSSTQTTAAKLAQLGSKSDAFHKAVEAVKTQLQDEINKISRYIN